jgi:pimeloyl-ACP methyl ester carboxylesterase
VPLQTDLTTPLAYFLDTPQFREKNIATAGLLNPHEQQDAKGLFMLEPYDPNRIPVLMVHGLWSSPLTWMDMFNDLRSFPEIRERYQFWFYLYPTGQPFWISAKQLRDDLASVRDTVDPRHQHVPMDQMVLVGHSMGGLVSRMQTLESGDDFWNIISDEPVDKLNGDPEDINKLVSTLKFNPNQSIRRVVTIATPHRGSHFANQYTQWLGRAVIKLPKIAVRTGNRLVKANPGVFKDTDLITINTSIDSLSPESPIFPVMLRAKTSPLVQYNNIYGVTDEAQWFRRAVGDSDGIVSTASARLSSSGELDQRDFQVNANHTTIHTKPETILKVRAILMEHLESIDQQDRVALQTRPESTTSGTPGGVASGMLQERQ